MNQYIPDMTERFPEGMRGEDRTDSYFGGGGIDYCDDREDEDYEEIIENSDLDKLYEREDTIKKQIDECTSEAKMECLEQELLNIQSDIQNERNREEF